jgi:predicted metal-binding membrane protein
MTTGSVPKLARWHRAMLVASTAAVTLAAWLWLTLEPAPHSRSALLLPHCHTGVGAASFVSVVVMWQAMSIAMMASTTLNWLFLYTALSSDSGSSGTMRAASAFLAGYFSVWFVYSVAAAGIQIVLQRTGLLDSGGKLPPTVAGLVLIGAGIAWFTPLSRACLRHCRNPMTYFVSHWDKGPRSGLRFGAAHALYCVGCCWLLMLTGFAMGVMNMIWMGFLTILIATEKLAPRGEWIAGLAATAMILWGAVLSFGISIVQLH